MWIAHFPRGADRGVGGGTSSKKSHADAIMYPPEPAGAIYSSGWWFGTFFIFPYIGNFIIPIDDLTFFRGVGIPPTSHVLGLFGVFDSLDAGSDESSLKMLKFSPPVIRRMGFGDSHPVLSYG